MSIYFIDTSLTTLTIEEVKRLKEELKTFYLLEFGEINTSPLDPQSLRQLEQIYVHLVLLSETAYENPMSLDYDRLFEIFADEKGKSRVAFLGEAGVGKTTLLSKIAYDWAKGEQLQDIDLLFFVRLREIERCSSFTEIPRKYISDGFKLQNNRLDEYMTTNQRKVLLLLDGLDEYKQDIKIENTDDVIIDIMRGDKLKRVPVIVTTRPWRAEQITSIDKINKRYTRIRVEGFKRHDVQVYIQRFFTNDLESAESLIRLAAENSLIAKTMAPYPIFCCMLCHMWKWIKVSDRERVRKLQTFSELIHEMINALVEQYAAKVREKGESLKDCQARCKSGFERIGEVAFRGLLVKQLAFNEDIFTDCMDAMRTGCEVGILSSKTKFAPSNVRQREGSEQLAEVSFPHKLLQEYLAGLYFASLYHVNRPEFEELLREKILTHPWEYEYVLYFMAFHGREPGQAGPQLIETLCRKWELKHYIHGEVLIAEIAFECHDAVAIATFINLFFQKTSLELADLTAHQQAAYMFTLASCGQKEVRTIYMLLLPLTLHCTFMFSCFCYCI